MAFYGFFIGSILVGTCVCVFVWLDAGVWCAPRPCHISGMLFHTSLCAFSVAFHKSLAASLAATHHFPARTACWAFRK